MTFPSHIQKLDLGDEVELFHFDLTLYSQGHLYLVRGDQGATIHAVTFGAQVYSPWTIDSDGWELTDEGALPRPRVTLANPNNVLTALVLNNNELKDCVVERFKTYDRFLVGGAEPDSTAYTPIDQFLINGLIERDHTQLTFELRSAIDTENSYLPGRLAMRDHCQRIYRRWNGASFDYSKATCPYTGTNYRDRTDTATTAANDRCARLLKSCRHRFGEDAELPFLALPGMARFRKS